MKLYSRRFFNKLEELRSFVEVTFHKSNNGYMVILFFKEEYRNVDVWHTMKCRLSETRWKDLHQARRDVFSHWFKEEVV
jgi:hypothetical protein